MTQRELEARLTRLEQVVRGSDAVPLAYVFPENGSWQVHESPGLVRTFDSLSEVFGHYRPQKTFLIVSPEQQTVCSTTG